MEIRKFQIDRDLKRLEAFLRDQYLENRQAVSWLPERLHDLVFRVAAQETAQGRVRSVDHIYLWEEAGAIAACVLPDGENIYVSIRTGLEGLFPSMVEFSEDRCLPLFPKAEDGSVKLWFAVSDSLPALQQVLADRGYRKYPEEEYMSGICPLEAEAPAKPPEGFRLVYGEEYPNEENKWSALRLSFHPDEEAPDFRADMGPYHARKRSPLYPDSFECLVVDENVHAGNDVCAYCFVYVDKQSKTALIEPVGTREPYGHRGIGTAMLHGAVRRCSALGIERCYVDNFGWRRDFYTAAGFHTEDSVGFWYHTKLL